MKTTRILLCLVICLTTKVFGDFGLQWNSLRTTFGVNKSSEWTFARMPLTRTEAKSENFKQIGGKDAPCCDGNFLGYRYVKNNDPAVILLYDVNGYIAGIQSSYPENTIKNTESLHWFKHGPMFTVEELFLNNNLSKSYTLTAYLVDPTIICSTGRTPQQFEESKGGTDLYLKNGTRNIIVPKQQTDLVGTSWTLGKCFPSMGLHYWYDTSKDMNCDYFQPILVLYNHGKLVAFNWALLANLTSKRYELPRKAILEKFLVDIPDCFLSFYDQVGQLSTQHVYMIDEPWNIVC